MALFRLPRFKRLAKCLWVLSMLSSLSLIAIVIVNHNFPELRFSPNIAQLKGEFFVPSVKRNPFNESRIHVQHFTPKSSFQGDSQNHSMITAKRRTEVVNALFDKPILTPNFIGRLGNQMFTYAATYSFALRKNMSVFLGTNQRLTSTFTLDQSVLTRNSCKSWKPVSAPCCGYYSYLEKNVANNKCQKVGVFLQSWKYFSDVSDKIRKQFTFKAHIAKTAHKKLSRFKDTYLNRRDNVTKGSNITDKNDVTFIGVHVRRGDYMVQRSIMEGRVTPKVDYYNRAMDYFRKIFTIPLFIVASDSPNWVRRNIKGPDVVVMEDNPSEVDLCILSHCNHSIISVGTFGWWAAFLAGGRTIYYKTSFRNGSAMSLWYKNYDSDFVYKNWTGM